MAKVTDSVTGGIFALHFLFYIKYLELVKDEGQMNCQCQSLLFFHLVRFKNNMVNIYGGLPVCRMTVK